MLRSTQRTNPILALSNDRTKILKKKVRFSIRKSLELSFEYLTLLGCSRKAISEKLKKYSAQYKLLMVSETPEEIRYFLEERGGED